MSKIDFNLENHWLPFTPNRSFMDNPRVLVGADGMYFNTHDGRRVLDGISSLWCAWAAFSGVWAMRSLLCPTTPRRLAC